MKARPSLHTDLLRDTPYQVRCRYAPATRFFAYHASLTRCCATQSKRLTRRTSAASSAADSDSLMAYYPDHGKSREWNPSNLTTAFNRRPRKDSSCQGDLIDCHVVERGGEPRYIHFISKSTKRIRCLVCHDNRYVMCFSIDKNQWNISTVRFQVHVQTEQRFLNIQFIM